MRKLQDKFNVGIPSHSVAVDEVHRNFLQVLVDTLVRKWKEYEELKASVPDFEISAVDHASVEQLLKWHEQLKRSVPQAALSVDQIENINSRNILS